MIYDARPVNENMATKRFKFEQLAKEGRTCFAGKKGAWIADLTSAFHHIEIFAGDRKYLGCCWKGKYMHWAGCPFGIKPAPRILSTLLKAVVTEWRGTWGMCILPFMDDLAGAANTTNQSMEEGQFAVTHLKKLGFIIQEKKLDGVFSPKTCIKDLGVLVNLQCQQFQTCPDRMEHIKEAAAFLLPSKGRAHRRIKDKSVARLCGLLICSTISLGSNTRLRTRDLYGVINSRLLRDEHGRLMEDPRDPATWGRWVNMTTEAEAEVIWWLTNLENVNGQAIAATQPPLNFQAEMGADASDTGWGAFLSSIKGKSDQELARNIMRWAPPGLSVRCASRLGRSGIEIFGIFAPGEGEKSSTWRELKGAMEAVALLGVLIAGLCVHLRLDSQAAVMILGGSVPRYPNSWFGGSRKPELQTLAITLHDMAAAVGATVQATWVPRELNTRCDVLSHENERRFYDYFLVKNVFKELDTAWGPHTVDRFSSTDTAQLPRFNTLYFTKKAEWVDSFTTTWDGETNYAFPPPKKTGEVLEIMNRDKARGTLIAFRWRGAPWYPLLFPNGDARPAAAFVREQWDFGDARRVLKFPATVPNNQQKAHFPHGCLTAFKLDFTKGSLC